MNASLPAQIEPNYFAEFNRMLPLPADDDARFDDEDRRLALGARLRLWRSGPAKGPELRAAVEIEVAEASERGELLDEERIERIERVAELLSGDTSIGDPPDPDETELELERCRERFARVHRPWNRETEIGASCRPVPSPDRFGNWPGVRWREALEHSLSKACPSDNFANGRPVPPSTSQRIAWLFLQREKFEQAEAVAESEVEGRRRAVEIALAALPVVFEGEQQILLQFLVRFYARGELMVPVSGDPLAEAKLLAELERNYDAIGLSPDQRADVVDELIRFVASQRAISRESRMVPTVGYAIVVDGNGEAVDVAPGWLRLTIESGQHVLRSPRWSWSVRMTSRDFRDWKRCAQAIYDQVGVEVDYPRGHWKRWWPSLAAQLGKTVEVIEDRQRKMNWEEWLSRIANAAPTLSHRPDDGSPYRGARDGRLCADRDWVVKEAIATRLIEPADEEVFKNWVGSPTRNRRNASGVQKGLIELPTNRPLLLGPPDGRSQSIELAVSKDANEPEKQR
jgi:hypothetical protein